MKPIQRLVADDMEVERTYIGMAKAIATKVGTWVSGLFHRSPETPQFELGYKSTESKQYGTI